MKKKYHLNCTKILENTQPPLIIKKKNPFRKLGIET